MVSAAIFECSSEQIGAPESSVTLNRTATRRFNGSTELGFCKYLQNCSWLITKKDRMQMCDLANSKKIVRLNSA